MRRIVIIVVVLTCLAAAAVWAQEGDVLTQVKAKMIDVNAKMQRLQQGVDDLEANYAREIDERERLMLQRRFVEGREFYYMLHDYRGGAEVFWGVVHHPLATSLPNYLEAVFYLAESLFNCGFFPEARAHYQIVLKAGRTEYFGLSLMRLIEIAVTMRDYGEADRLYGLLLSEFPEEEDGSLGRYIIGKSFYKRGETAKAIEILDSIPETGNYYATAQYFVAAIRVKQRDYKDAVNRLRRLKEALKLDMANKKQIYALTHLALGRIYYEMDDFPQAMARYFTVPPESPEYPQALFESMWVFITRNDYLLQAIEDERTKYEDLLFDFTGFRENVNDDADRGGLEAVAAETEQLQGEIDEIGTIFDDIDKSLARLQEEALTSFNKLVEAAPRHQLMPEAELLAGNIYAQVEDFNAAEEWYKKIRAKYENFYAAIRNSRGSLSPQDHIDIVSAGTHALANDAPIDTYSTRGLPEEVVYWLAEKERVSKLFAVYEAVLAERANLAKMRDIVNEIDIKLSEMDGNVGGYPILREAKRKSTELSDGIMALQVEITALRSQAGQLGEAPEAAQAMGEAAAHEQTLANIQSRLAALSAKIEAKKQERLAYYRQQLATLREPLYNYNSSVESLLARVQDDTAQAATAELAELEKQIYSYVERADLGIIDVFWRSTRTSNREMRDIQRQMQQEIRQFQRLQRPEGETTTTPAPTDGDEAAPAGGGGS